jgi:hypothetical protein
MDVLITGITGCGYCGDPIERLDQGAIVYDPTDPEGESDIVHADTCIPKGWEQA